MHPKPRRALLAATAAVPAASAHRSPVIPGIIMEGHMDALPSLRLRVAAA